MVLGTDWAATRFPVGRQSNRHNDTATFGCSTLYYVILLKFRAQLSPRTPVGVAQVYTRSLLKGLDYVLVSSGVSYAEKKGFN
eukprot:6181560-Pleurochrysis_carterae.AAC.2